MSFPSVSSATGVRCIGPISGGVVYWTYRRVLRATVVVKVSCVINPLEPGGSAGAGPSHRLRPTQPDPVHGADKAYPGDAARIAAPSDFVPYLNQAELLFVGRATAGASAAPVRIALVRATRTLLHKGAMVSPGTAGLGFGPLSSTTPMRQALLRGTPAPAGSTLALPDDMDFSYFQSSPADQRLDVILPGDAVYLEHLHPRCDSVSFAIPGEVPVLTAQLGSNTATIPLRCDTLLIDTDREICTLSFRGNTALPGQDVGAVSFAVSYAPSEPLVPVVDATTALGDFTPSTPATPFSGAGLLQRLRSGAAPLPIPGAPFRPSALKMPDLVIPTSSQGGPVAPPEMLGGASAAPAVPAPGPMQEVPEPVITEAPPELAIQVTGLGIPTDGASPREIVMPRAAEPAAAPVRAPEPTRQAKPNLRNQLYQKLAKK